MGNLVHAARGWLQLYFSQKIVVRAESFGCLWLAAEPMDTRKSKGVNDESAMDVDCPLTAALRRAAGSRVPAGRLWLDFLGSRLPTASSTPTLSDVRAVSTGATRTYLERSECVNMPRAIRSDLLST